MHAAHAIQHVALQIPTCHVPAERGECKPAHPLLQGRTCLLLASSAHAEQHNRSASVHSPVQVFTPVCKPAYRSASLYSPRAFMHVANASQHIHSARAHVPFACVLGHMQSSTAALQACTCAMQVCTPYASQHIALQVCTCHVHGYTSHCKSARASSIFFSSRGRHTRCSRDWSSDVCSSDLRACCRQRWRCSSAATDVRCSDRFAGTRRERRAGRRTAVSRRWLHRYFRG